MATYSEHEQRRMDAQSGQELDRRAGYSRLVYDKATREIVAVTYSSPQTDAHEQRREAMARLLAATLMRLTKGPTGSELPRECWEQMLPKADAVLFIASDDTAHTGRRSQALCDDCPPVGYPTDKTRCLPCPRRMT